MQFGLSTHLPWPENTVPRRLIEEITEQVHMAKPWGSRAPGLRSTIFAAWPGLLVAGAAWGTGAHTRTIRLGLPSWCRRYTTRFDWPKTLPWSMSSATGASMSVLGGSAGYEYHGYGLDRNESQQRFQESIRMILGLWTTPEYSQQGQFSTINQATLVPPVVQQPHPPVILPRRAPRQRWSPWSRPASPCSWGWCSTRSRRWTSAAVSCGCRPRPALTSRCPGSPSYGIVMLRRRTSKRWQRRGRAWNGPWTRCSGAARSAVAVKCITG